MAMAGIRVKVHLGVPQLLLQDEAARCRRHDISFAVGDQDRDPNLLELLKERRVRYEITNAPIALVCTNPPA